MQKTYYVTVRGITHSNSDGTSRQEIAKSVRKGQKVELIADPLNKHDRWAVKVIVNGVQIGFLPSDARDASSLLKGEQVSATIHKVTGGTNWFSRNMLGKESIGVVLSLSKTEPDWGRYNHLIEVARPIDELIENARKIEKAGDIGKAINMYINAISEVNKLTEKDKYASAHRRCSAPINRLSLLLEKKKDYKGAWKVIEDFYSTFDPVQPDKSDRISIDKRHVRLCKKLNIN